MKTIIIGLGNPLLGDDSVGWRVAEQVKQRLGAAGGPVTLSANKGRDEETVEVDCLALGGLSLMERMVDFDRAVLIDAMLSGKAQVGSVYALTLDDLPNYSDGHITAIHDTSLQTALQVGKTMGAHLPTQIEIIGIECMRVYDFTEELSLAVSKAIPQAVQMVLDLLTRSRKEEP